MKQLLLFAFLIAIQLNANAAINSSGVGNGGDAVVCANSVELLDVYEARLMHLNLEFGDKKDYRSMVTHVTNKLKKKDLFLANLLEKYSLEMVNYLELFLVNPNARGEFVNLGYLQVTEVDDSMHVAIPIGCEIIQLVNQREPEFSLQFRYTINESLWERLDIENQVMTILHEAWYRIMIEHGAKDSRSSRFMNALVASSYLEGISFNQYFDDLKKTELKYYMIVNNSSAIKSPHIKINMSKYILNYDESVDEICAPRLIFTANFIKRSKRIKTSFKYVCFSNSRLTSLKLSSTYATKSFDIKMENFTLEMDGSDVPNPTIFFHTNGKLKNFKGIQVDSLIFKSGKAYKFASRNSSSTISNSLALNVIRIRVKELS